MPRLIFGSWIRLFGFILFLSLLNSCVKNDDLPEPDVYVAGSIGKWDNHLPCLWKNGVRANLDAEEGRRQRCLFQAATYTSPGSGAMRI